MPRRRPRLVVPCVPLRACAEPTNTTSPNDATQTEPKETPKVVLETLYQDRRYGTCSQCGEPVVIPGVSHSFCAVCGWVKRPDEELRSQEETVKSAGHHD